MRHKYIERGAEYPQITYSTHEDYFSWASANEQVVLVAVSKDKIGREIGTSILIKKKWAETADVDTLLAICDRLAYSIIQRRDAVLQCEQCGKELDEETVEVCDECGGIFCQMHVNVMDNDDILCDTCAIEREDEEGDSAEV